MLVPQLQLRRSFLILLLLDRLRRVLDQAYDV